MSNSGEINEEDLKTDSESASEDYFDEDEDFDDEFEDEEMDEESNNQEDTSVEIERRTYVPKADGESDQPLEYDPSAYLLYHKAETSFPCLSFDFIKDNSGSGELRANTFPISFFMVAGTQAPKAHINKLMILKMVNLNKLKQEKEDSEDSDEESEHEDGPEMLCAPLKHNGCVNRVRATNLNGKDIVSTWSDSGNVYIWDLTSPLMAVSDNEAMKNFSKTLEQVKPLFSFNGHQNEGYALDWSSLKPGWMASGDCIKNIFIWKPIESSWHVDQIPLKGHTNSVEDLQWSPTEESVLASCSVDKSIRIWDIRAKHNSSCMVTLEEAHESDINVISWNKLETSFILSGGDDGTVKTWDLRQFNKKKPRPIAVFKHHSLPITSIEWHPTDSTVFAASGSDNQITLWDLAVEKDNENEDEEDVARLPPQLLFIHQGQKEVKELHWHPQIPGLTVSTGLNGIDIFRTISV